MFRQRIIYDIEDEQDVRNLWLDTGIKKMIYLQHKRGNYHDSDSCR